MTKLREGWIAMMVGAGLAYPLLIAPELLSKPQGSVARHTQSW